jgi:hypothetical protein
VSLGMEEARYLGSIGTLGCFAGMPHESTMDDSLGVFDWHPASAIRSIEP